MTRGTTVPKERDIRALLLQSIAHAQRFIYMEDQYLINREAAVALNAAIPRLRHLTILITASETVIELICPWKFHRDFIADLTRGLSPADLAKVRIFQLVTPPPATPPRLGRHTWVHSKAWVFDDELAVIGSANCNRRGWQHDSEANAFIFDGSVPSSGADTFAQDFRARLWAEHLNTTTASVRDGVTSAGLWLSPPAGARVMRYNPTAGTDTLPDRVCEASRFQVDPFIP